MRTKKLLTLVAIILSSGMVFAQTTALQDALSALCSGLSSMVPVAARLMVLLASVIYAVGQMMGAETRARANVWATSCLTGALIGILISVIAPGVLGVIAGNGISISCT
jgi:hypothetical protein